MTNSSNQTLSMFCFRYFALENWLEDIASYATDLGDVWTA